MPDDHEAAVGAAKQRVWDTINAELAHHKIVVRDNAGLRRRTELAEAVRDYEAAARAAGRAEAGADVADALGWDKAKPWVSALCQIRRGVEAERALRDLHDAVHDFLYADGGDYGLEEAYDAAGGLLDEGGE